MFFRFAKYAVALEIVTIMFLSLVNEQNFSEFEVFEPQVVLASNIEAPKPTPSTIKIMRNFTPTDTLKALEHASSLAKCIVKHEVGGGTKIYEPWSPYSIGAAGELGAVQLHPKGKLPEFYKLGFNNPFDPYQSVIYLEGALKRGQKYHWTAVVKGWC